MCTYSFSLPILLCTYIFSVFAWVKFYNKFLNWPFDFLCRKSQWMSVTTTYLFSLALIVHDRTIASRDSVGELVSS